jgi:hypothetical protein
MDLTFCKCNYHSFTLYLLMQSLHHALLDVCKYLMMQNYLWQMMRMRAAKEVVLNVPESSTGHGCGQPLRANAPPPPPPCPSVSLDQLLATQNDLMRLLMQNETRHGAYRPQPKPQDRNSSYSNFLATHPPLFSEVMEPLEVDNWLRTTESKFGLLHLQSIRRLCTSTTTSRLSGSLVGLIHCCTTS